jgi:lysophospholipase L1-like esterase
MSEQDREAVAQQGEAERSAGPRRAGREAVAQQGEAERSAGPRRAGREAVAQRAGAPVELGQAERSSARPAPRGRPAKRPSRPFASAGLALAATLAALAAAETLARACGFAPWVPDPVAAAVEPGGSLYLPDPVLGYALRPGSFEVTLPSGLRFHATHDAEGHRASGRPGARAPRAEIWIFGDSFSYGWAVSDEETFAWLLQAALPRQRVVNFAVGGYGTLHALLQLEQALRSRPRPALVVLAHNFFHGPRNTFSRLRRREVAPWNRLGPIEHPIARLGPGGALELASAPVGYAELPLMRRSALANLAATALDLADDRRLRSHEVTRALLARFVAAARAAGAPVLVTTLEASAANAPLLDHVASLGARVADVSVDLRIRENTNLPHDGHPSALAHRRYARRLAPRIEQALAATPGD